jgi:hypothetical protein
MCNNHGWHALTVCRLQGMQRQQQLAPQQQQQEPPRCALRAMNCYRCPASGAITTSQGAATRSAATAGLLDAVLATWSGSGCMLTSKQHSRKGVRQLQQQLIQLLLVL